MRRKLTRRCLLAGGAVAPLAGVLAACTGSAPHAGTGVVLGHTPTCYGPGPNTNLKPIAVIHAIRTDGFSRNVKVHTANFHNTYRLTLPAGAYKISTYSGHIRVAVRAGELTRHADLPQPGCL